MAATASNLPSLQSTLYYNEVMDNYKNIYTKISQKELMTKQWVDMMIERITAAEMVVEKEGYSSLHESIKTTLRTYLVDTKNSKKMLVVKPVPGKEHRSKTIIPLEESYDVVQKAHLLTHHGTCQEMETWFVNNNYLINSMCSEIFCRLCAMCVPKKMPAPPEQDLVEQSIAIQAITDDMGTTDEVLSGGADPGTETVICDEKSFDHVCSVDVLDISENPDISYEFLLIYEDKKTNYIQLRPLTSNSETEIAMELIKILMDFGPPECIVVDADNKIIFQHILDRVNVLASSTVSLALHKSENKMIQKVAKNVISWMKEQDCKNWGTGCHIVQWNMNNKPDIFGNTPFSRVFGYKYTGFGFKSKFLSKDLVNDNSDSDDDLVLIENDGDINSQNVNKTHNKEEFIVTLTEDDIKTEVTDAELLSDNPTFKLSKIKFESSDED